MSTTARRVTEAEALGKSDPMNAEQTLRRKYESTHLDVRIPATQFDDIRLAVRAATYRNSAEEEATIAAVDDAISERVQRAAASILQQAGHLLDTEGRAAELGPRQTPNALAKAQRHLDELTAIRKELRRGKTPTAELAERYERVRTALRADGHSLIVLNQKATKLQEKVADPKAAVSKTLALMPLSTWRPLGVGKF